MTGWGRQDREDRARRIPLLWRASGHGRPSAYDRLSGEAEFRGRGIAYCATCDGEFFTGKGGFCHRRRLCRGGGERFPDTLRKARHRTDSRRGFLLRRGCVARRQRASEDHCPLPYRSGGGHGGYGAAYDTERFETGEETVFAPQGDTFGVFVFAGYEPETALIRDKIETDPRGHIVTDGIQRTTLEGIRRGRRVREGSCARWSPPWAMAQRLRQRWKVCRSHAWKKPVSRPRKPEIKKRRRHPAARLSPRGYSRSR